MISVVVPRLEAKVGGQAQRRGLIPRAPSRERMLTDATIWLTGEYPDAVRSTRQRSLESGATELAIDLHPAAPPLIITAEGAGRITVVGETAQAGPGYHRFVGRVLERLGSEIGIEWTHGDGAATFADRPTVERAYLGWLGPQLTRARVAVQRGQRGVHVGIPPAIRVTTDAALATVLGPRAEAWLDSAIADPRVAIEITPWWADASDGKTLLNRALALMWLEVRWRPPVIEGEPDVLDEIHRSLSRASAMDVDLDYPWHAWAQVCGYRGIADPFAKQAEARATRAPEPDLPVGYRRGPVRITHEGWSLTIPGPYAERPTADGWWAGTAGRSITIAVNRTTTPDRPPLAAQAFIDQSAAELGPNALHHQSGEVLGRARLTTDPTSGIEVGVLQGYSAIRGSGAAIRIEFEDAADWQWAIDLWRSLSPG